ncbi:MAG: metallophosphoesterase family protein [Candidatus Promineifilaceae bacterium]|nr:metallophosphoesterase family protein [Candidatus Promineifilaceae bacterium]
MRIAIISDIHGNISALEAVLEDIERRGVKEVVNLGDSLSGPFDARAVADLLMSRGDLTISGNHDRALWDRPRSDMGLWEEWAWSWPGALTPRTLLPTP